MGNGMNKILPNLYVGNFSDSKNLEQINQNHITHILSIYDDAEPILKGKKYLCISAQDNPSQNLLPHFRKCIKFIHRARLEGGTVLVHCLAGVSRSVTVTVSYMITSTDHDWRNALNAVRQQRSCANPNFGFQKQLQSYQDNTVKDERLWFKKKFGPNPFKDQDEIEQLYKQYEADRHKPRDSRFDANELKQVVDHKNAQRAATSGSTSSSFPLNEREDLTPSSRWEKSKGFVMDE